MQYCRILILRAITFSVLLLIISRPAFGFVPRPVEDQLPKSDFIIRGKIIEIKASEILKLSVTRYYKGSGPAIVTAKVGNLSFQRMDWDRIPKVGDDLLIGLRQDGDSYRNNIGQLFIMIEPGQGLPADLTKLLGPGRPPEGKKKLQLKTGPLIATLSFTVLGVFVLLKRLHRK